ncbi:MerR family transcriptional regulator [Qingshengfaniella alkalisoli]|uniref:Helix-turn-helix domain-containing protein n=1 Tax=Qingshengfaniella alkalisoli TaxID=2599296 RepID=A0A5B8I7H5_9RHOB|nr:helix-turn-helix domain-containing protein [Qingshengfaniella alkalisoli]QDY69725.1 helix-turn-helix domain-containing protein [Qingshengfaniella alkalisoli]
MLSIGDLSRETGVKIPTIRYYEQMGLVEPEGRTNGNQRRYSRDGLERLSFIKHARELGLSLDAIRALITLDETSAAELSEAHHIAQAHLSDVQSRIARLKRLESELKRMLRACDGDHAHGCDLLQAFSDHSHCETEH